MQPAAKTNTKVDFAGWYRASGGMPPHFETQISLAMADKKCYNINENKATKHYKTWFKFRGENGTHTAIGLTYIRVVATFLFVFWNRCLAEQMLCL